MASILAAYPGIAGAITTAIHDSNVAVLDKFMDYLAERVDEADALKEFLVEFKKELGADFETENKKIKKATKGVVKPEKKKRGPTGYSLFIGTQMRKIREENPNFDSKEVMSEAMKYWKSLSEEEKAKYTKAAKDSTETSKTESSEQTDSTVEEHIVEVQKKPKKTSKKSSKKSKKSEDAMEESSDE